jgi:hypothetical protein
MNRRATLIFLALVLLPASVLADGFHSPLLRNKDPKRWAETTRKSLGLDKSDTAEEEDGAGDAFRRRAAAGQLTDVLKYLDKKNVLLREFPNFNYDKIPEFKSETEALLIAIGKDAVPLLVQTIITDLTGAATDQPGVQRVKDFRKRVIVILVAIGEDSLPEVMRNLTHADSKVRAVMLQIVRGIVTDPDFGVSVDNWKRWFAIHSAGKNKDRKAIPELQKALAHADVRIRRAAAGALGEIKSRDAVPGLTAAMAKTSDPKLIGEICRALAKIGDRRAAPKLIALLTDKRLPVRREAATALRFLTREMKGYDATAPEKDRQAAVNRWREWWEREMLKSTGK